MGSSFSSPDSNFHANSHSTSKQKLLSLYSYICDTHDQSLGKLHIYRKNQYNFDYVAVSQKIVQLQFIDQLKNIIKIDQIIKAKSQSSNNAHELKYLDNKFLKSGDYWVKVYGFENYQLQDASTQHRNLVLYFQYFNFTIKEYVEKSIHNLYNFHNSNQPSPQLAYIICSIIDRYLELCVIRHLYPYINIEQAIISITTMSLIYLDIDGFIKFMPVPLFALPDYSSNVDQCLTKCCKFDGEVQNRHMMGMNMIIPKYGQRTPGLYGRPTNDDYMQKIFMSRFKKMLKYIRREMQKFENSLAKIDTFKGRTIDINRNIQANTKINNKTINSDKNKYIGDYIKNRSIIDGQQKHTITAIHTNPNQQNQNRSYWDELQNAGNVRQLIRQLKRVDKIATNLQTGNNANKNNNKFDNNLMRSLLKQGQKTQKIKLDKLAHVLKNNSANTTISSYNLNLNNTSINNAQHLTNQNLNTNNTKHMIKSANDMNTSPQTNPGKDLCKSATLNPPNYNMNNYLTMPNSRINQIANNGMLPLNNYIL